MLNSLVIAFFALLPGSAEAESTRLPLDFSLLAEPGQWQLESGRATTQDQQVILQDGSTIVYCDFTYDDFVVELDYRVLGTGSMQPVVRLRGERQSESGQWHGPAITLTRSEPVKRNRRRAIERGTIWSSHSWHHLRVECIGDHAVVYQDGVRIGSSQLNRRSGLLALSACGDCRAAVVYRDVVVTELTHRPLFNGHDLTGWEGAGSDANQCWEVQEGMLVCTGSEGPWLRSQEQFGDFNLRLQYLIGEGGNSGVYVRVPADGLHHGAGAGVEVQILDDISPRYRDLKPYQFSASLYAIAPAIRGWERPVGNWNALEIDCSDSHYRVTHNGETVIDTSEVEYPELARRLKHGYLGLQNHSESVWFRQIRIGPSR